MNKPCLSITDIINKKIEMNEFDEEDSKDISSIEIYFDDLKSLVKSKL